MHRLDNCLLDISTSQITTKQNNIVYKTILYNRCTGSCPRRKLNLPVVLLTSGLGISDSFSSIIDLFSISPPPPPLPPPPPHSPFSVGGACALFSLEQRRRRRSAVYITRDLRRLTLLIAQSRISHDSQFLIPLNAFFKCAL